MSSRFPTFLVLFQLSRKIVSRGVVFFLYDRTFLCHFLDSMFKSDVLRRETTDPGNHSHGISISGLNVYIRYLPRQNSFRLPFSMSFHPEDNVHMKRLNETLLTQMNHLCDGMNMHVRSMCTPFTQGAVRRLSIFEWDWKEYSHGRVF